MKRGQEQCHLKLECHAQEYTENIDWPTYCTYWHAKAFIAVKVTYVPGRIQTSGFSEPIQSILSVFCHH